MEAGSRAAGQIEETTPLARRGMRRWYWCLFGVSALGTLDIGQFLATNQSMFRLAPGRAAGSVLGLVLWLALTGLSLSAASGHGTSRLSRTILPVSGLLAVGSLGLVAVHAAARVGGLRPAVGGVLGLSALGIAWLASRD
ncbi:MAG: hypothetical protein WA695_09665 [Candidatus Dormiibacterota bacterium]